MITVTAWARLLLYAVLLTACLYLTSEGNKLNRSLWGLIIYIHRKVSQRTVQSDKGRLTLSNWALWSTLSSRYGSNFGQTCLVFSVTLSYSGGLHQGSPGCLSLFFDGKESHTNMIVTKTALQGRTSQLLGTRQFLCGGEIQMSGHAHSFLRADLSFYSHKNCLRERTKLDRCTTCYIS